MKKNVKCDKPAETLDLTATFLDYAGIKKPADMDGLTLRPFLEGKGLFPRKYAVSSLKNWALVYDGRYKLVAGKNAFKLYDLKNDVSEIDDISDKHPDIVERLKPHLPPVNPYNAGKKDKKKKKKKKEK